MAIVFGGVLVAIQVLIVVHVIAAAVWLGAGLGTVRRLRRGVSEGGAVLAMAVEDARQMLRWRIGGALVTIATGLALVFATGGLEVAPMRIHIGLGSTLAALLVELALVRPSIVKVQDDLEGRRALKRVAAGTGVVHLLWVVALVTMVWRF